MLLLLVPIQIFCLEQFEEKSVDPSFYHYEKPDCEEILRERIKDTVTQLIPYFTRDKDIDCEFYYLYGEYSAYNDALCIICE